MTERNDGMERTPPASAAEALCQELVVYYQRLHRAGLNDSHSGNASVRDGDFFWITPTGAGAETLEPRDLLRCPLSGELPEGASLDAPLHAEVYRRNASSRALLHSHGPHAIAMTLSAEMFCPVDFEGNYYFGDVAVLDIPYPQYVELSPEAVGRALEEAPVVIVRGHGVYAHGESLDRAYKWSCSLESSARIAWLQEAARGPNGRG